MPTNARSVTNYKHDSQQSGTKGSLPPPWISCRRFPAVKTSTRRTRVRRRHDLRALDSVPIYRLITQKPAINLIHPRFLLTPARTLARAKIIIVINYRRKSRWFCTTSRNIESPSLTRVVDSPMVFDVFKPERTSKRGAL